MGWRQPEVQREQCALEQQAGAHQAHRRPHRVGRFNTLRQYRDIYTAEIVVEQRHTQQVA